MPASSVLSAANFSQALAVARLKAAAPVRQKAETGFSSVPLEIDDTARRAFEDGQAIAERLSQGAKSAKSYATSIDVESKRQRLMLLKLLAQTATDSRTIRSIAREVAEIARGLAGLAGGGGGGDLLQSVAAGAANASLVASSAPSVSATDLVASVETAAIASLAAEASMGSDVDPSVQTRLADSSSPSALSPAGEDADLRAQVESLVRLARKILDKLRERAQAGSRDAEEINKAGREVERAAQAFGVSSGGVSTLSVDAVASQEVSFSLDIVAVEVSLSIDIRV